MPGSKAVNHRFVPGTRLLGLAAAAPLAVTMLVPTPHAGPAPKVPAAQAQHPVPVHAVLPHPARRAAMRTWHLPAPRWPQPGQATVAVPGSAGLHAARLRGNTALAGPTLGSASAGSLPVSVGPAAARSGRVGPVSLRITMTPRQLAAKDGVAGVIFALARAGTGPAVRVHVSVDYAAFAYADGGNFASRLRLAVLPSCALTDPGLPACLGQTPVPTYNNVATTRLGADVTVPAGQTIVLATITSTSGSGGDYAASPLSPSGTWSAGGSSGAFTYSYPITVPPVPGGLVPDIRLHYNSQAVDGLTSSTNSQASWIGDGWDYQPGSISRDYTPCSQVSGAPSADKTGDMCWSSNDVTTMSLGGVTTTLLYDSSKKAWYAEADNGEKISYVTRGSNCSSGTFNGTADGGYWVVTDPDGTSYYFGLNHLPGYASGDTTTGSAWTLPVYATSSSYPCYNSTFTSSHGPQAWRWNLDYVTDSHGNAMTLLYTHETNYYAAGNPVSGTQTNTKATAGYAQAGALQKIIYGFQNSSNVYGSGTTPAGAAEVDVTTAQDRADVPTGGSQDLACSSGATCTVISPSFWSKYRLTTIATKALNGTSMQPADSWALSQSYPPTGDTTPPSLWLDSIQRTGEDGGSIQLLPLSFSGQPLANRVDLSTGYLPYTRLRLNKIITETGAKINVWYSAGACPSPRPTDYANTTLCYPDWWTPPQHTQIEDWFNKYVVTEVAQNDMTGTQPAIVTNYCYGTSPDCLNGGAWHYNDDALVRSQQRTWDQWRGFSKVTTMTGSAPDPVTQVTDRFFQGMDGDYKSTGNVSLSATVGGVTITATDSDQFAGMTFEHIVSNGQGGAVVSDTVTTPWTSAVTGTQSQPSPLPPLNAFMTGTGKARTFTALASGGYRESDVTYHHDSRGRVDWQSSVPDAFDNGQAGDPSQDTCTVTSYAENTSGSNWLVDLPKQVTVTAETPANCPPASGTVAKSALVSDKQYFYNGATSLSSDVPTAGDVTMTKAATAYDGTTETWTTESTDVYDAYGRVKSSTDADNNITTTSYNPTTGAEPTSVTVNDPMNLATTTTYDPLRNLPTQVTSPAGYVTTKTYDALGRLTAVWLPVASKAGGQKASYTYAYTVSATAPSYVTTGTIEPDGTTYLYSTSIYDSLGRLLETQTATPDGNRDITDVRYNDDGWKSVVSHPYNASGVPSGQLDTAKDSQVPYQTGYTYDRAGRVIKEITFNKAQDMFETDTTYGGNFVTVIPPQGGTAKTTYTDGRGLTKYIYQYHSSPPPSSPPAPGSGSQAGTSGWDETAYTHDAAARLTGITDSAGDSWSYAFDLAGDQVSATTPDAGTSTMTYDNAGLLLSRTNAAGKTVSYAYDADNRKIRECADTTCPSTATTTLLAAWTWDTLAKGELTKSVSYVGGSGGTTYTEQMLGYTSFGASKGLEVSVSAGPLAGNYITQYVYTNAGQIAQYGDTAAGGLPAETVNIGWDATAEPVDINGTTSTGSTSYVPALSYTELGQPLEYTFGSSSAPAYLSDYYDYLGRLTEAKTSAGVSPVTVDDVNYFYDDASLVTSEADTPSGGPAQVQCFGYDGLGRLNQAWSQGAAGCSAGPSQSAEAGAAAQYWQQYTYDSRDNLTQVISTPSSGQAVTYTSKYGEAGTGGGPHAVTSQWTGGTQTAGYSYNQAGELAGISTSARSDTLSWDANEKLSSVTSGSTAVASYVYDAAGNLLVRTDGSTSTLYLADEEITSTNGTLSGVRYYSLGAVTVAVRTSTGRVSYLVGDQQGTSTVSIDSVSLNVTRRYFDPYGNPVGPPPSWSGTRGFVGGSADTVTGFTNLGAREYNPGTSAFICPDPLQSPYNPQDLNPYAYAGDDPATNSDPSGLMYMADGGGGYSSPVYTPPPFPYSYGRTSPGGWFGLAANMVHTLLFSAPPPVAVRSPRVRVPHQAATGTPSSCGGVAFRLAGPACRINGMDSGGFNPFSWALGQIKQHWRGLAQIGIAGLAIVGGAVCLASVACAAAVATAGATVGLSAGGSVVAASAVVGAGAGVASYQVSGGQRTLRGYLAAGALGALSGATGGAWGLAAKGASLTFAAAGAGGMALNATISGGAYMLSTPSQDRSPPGLLQAEILGAVSAAPFDARVFGLDG